MDGDLGERGNLGGTLLTGRQMAPAQACGSSKSSNQLPLWELGWAQHHGCW